MLNLTITGSVCLATEHAGRSLVFIWTISGNVPKMLTVIAVLHMKSITDVVTMSFNINTPTLFFRILMRDVILK